ncbi:MAG: hypothetical protein DHS20C01_04490 [marine bacterium B5-7]|nr:MAG: hypothetical protein DHS20C01_04490 [marine bacterium B5-7]
MVAAVIALGLMSNSGILMAAERVMLVLDASGSMWGQIDGVTKIEIARDAVKSLLSNWQDGRDVGLMAYGHRRKGDCSDIEVMLPAAPLDPAQMATTVDGLTPKGKTPLSAAVKQAAESLKYTEDKATVVLVSDGRETCDMDPCALGLELESAGIDFTAHVIGFDVSDVKDQAGLKCLAENTGGQFVAAANAEELIDALLETAAPPAGAAEPAQSEPLPAGTLEAPQQANKGTRITIVPDSPEVAGGYVYLYPVGGKRSVGYGYVRHDGTDYQPIELRLPGIAGKYEIRWMLADKRVIATRPIEVTEPDISLDTAANAIAGTEIEISLNAPPGLGGYLYLYRSGSDKSLGYAYAREAATGGYQTAAIRLPVNADNYIVRWIGEDKSVYAEAELTAIEAETSIEAPASVASATEISITPIGPDGLKGYIYLYAKNSDKSLGYAYVRPADQGGYQTAEIRVPANPGRYELRWLSDRKEVLARSALEVTVTLVDLIFDSSAPIATRLDVAIEAPSGLSGQVQLFAPGAKRFYTYAYVRESATGGYEQASLALPAAPGKYVIRWISDRKEVLVEKPITVEEAPITITAPAETPAGSRIDVSLDAPAGIGGQVHLYRPGAKKFLAYAYIKEDNLGGYADSPLIVIGTPGSYILKWISDRKEVLAEAPIEIVPVEVSMQVPGQITLAEAFEVVIDAPAGILGRVHLVAPNGKSITSLNVREGQTTNYAPVLMRAPHEAGEYQVVFKTRDGVDLKSIPLSVVE